MRRSLLHQNKLLVLDCSRADHSVVVKIPPVIQDCWRTSDTATSADAHCHQELAKLDISVYWESPSNGTVSLLRNAKKRSAQILLPPNRWCNLGNIKLEPSRGSHPSANLFTATELWTSKNFHSFYYKSCLLKEPFLTSVLYSPEALIQLCNKSNRNLHRRRILFAICYRQAIRASLETRFPTSSMHLNHTASFTVFQLTDFQ